MVVDTPFVAPLPAVGADEVTADITPTKAPRPGEVQGVQTPSVAVVRRAPRASAPMARDAVLALRSARVDPCFVSTKAARPLRFMAAPAVLITVAADVDRLAEGLEVTVTEPKPAALAPDGALRPLKLPSAMEGARPEGPEPWPSVPRSQSEDTLRSAQEYLGFRRVLIGLAVRIADPLDVIKRRKVEEL